MALDFAVTFPHWSHPLLPPPIFLPPKSLLSANAPDRAIDCHRARSAHSPHQRRRVARRRIRAPPFSSVSLDGFESVHGGYDEFPKRINRYFPKFIMSEADSRIESEAESPNKTAASLDSFDPPLSLRILNRNKTSPVTDSVYCSVMNAFSSVVLIISELQNHTIQMWEVIFWSSSDIQIKDYLIAKVQGELSTSYVWLFHHIFSSTPALMVYLMLLLANFTVNSISDYPTNAQLLPTQFESPDVKKSLSPFLRSYPTEVNSYSVSRSAEVRGRDSDREVHRIMARKMEDVDRIRASPRREALYDPDKPRPSVSTTTTETKADDLSIYVATEFSYQRTLAEDPDNPLILSNFGQFLFLVHRDYNRGEEYLKRAAAAKPADAEALSRYANFLWVARNDLVAAEERFLEAIEAEPENSHHAANYAHFLWITGGKDTCYPLD